MEFNAYRFRQLEKRYPGFGAYVLRLIGELPVLAATPAWTVDQIRNVYWQGCEDESGAWDEHDENVLTRKEVEKIFEPWMLDTRRMELCRVKHDFRLNCCLERELADSVERLENAVAEYRAFDRKGFSPEGIDLPGIVLKFGKRDRLTGRMIDSCEEYLSQTGCAWSSGYVFAVDGKTDFGAVFDEMELVIEAVNSAVDVLLGIEYFTISTGKPLRRIYAFDDIG
jgi:hypothetical protein